MTQVGGAIPQFSETYLSERKMELISSLILYQIGFTALVFVITIFQSHKIAGPIFKLQNYLKRIAKGESPSNIQFRKSDNFRDLAEDINNAFNKIREEHNNDLSAIEQVRTYINNLSLVIPEDKKSILNEINTKLTEIQERIKIDQ